MKYGRDIKQRAELGSAAGWIAIADWFPFH
jgi:hypothetical protein